VQTLLHARQNHTAKFLLTGNSLIEIALIVQYGEGKARDRVVLKWANVDVAPTKKFVPE
jgi:hypothetical protein